jgi:maleylpyruvate isomerase
VVESLTEEQARGPSLLPDWSVAHLLTHLARNADSVVRRVEGAARGEVVAQYPGGHAGRAAEIEAGASRPVRELVDDVVSSSAKVDDAFRSLPAEAWDRLSRSVSGDEQPVSVLPFNRWREVEVHLVDLGLGYQPVDWPDALIEAWLPQLLADLPARTDAKALAAWVLRRGPAPDLEPY